MARASAAQSFGIVHGLQGQRAGFVLALFETPNPTQAARQVGAKKPDDAASRWLRQTAVQEAISKEIARRQTPAVDARIERLRMFLEAVVFTPITDFMTWDRPPELDPKAAAASTKKNGKAKQQGKEMVEATGTTMTVTSMLYVRTLAELPREAHLLIKSIKQKITINGAWLEIEFYDKLAAAQILARTYGMFQEQGGPEDLAGIGEKIAQRAAYARQQRDLKLPASGGRVIDNETGEDVVGGGGE